MDFKLHAPYSATGDQPEAIRKLTEGVRLGLDEQVLLGVTGSGKTFTMASADDVAQMLAGAETSLRAAGYTPYYLYRQKYMSGSFENIGWCRPGTAGLYNIYMMEEMHSIVSLGGGAMTKINLPDGRLERFHNPKFPQQYLERIDDVLAQKDAAFRLL